MKQNYFSVHIDTSSDQFHTAVSQGDFIFCAIHVIAGSTAFPSPNWEDDAVALLNGWLEGCIELIGVTVSVRNIFLEGPYEFISRRLNDSVLVTFHVRTVNSREQVGEAVTVPLKQYMEGMMHPARQLANTLDRLSYSGRSSPDFEAMKHRLEFLQQSL